MGKKTKDKCCICDAEIVGFGHNPQPIKNKDGQDFKPGEDNCCLDCNNTVVIPERIKHINSRRYN